MIKLSKNSRLLVISLVLVLVGMIGASYFQTSLGKVKVKNMNWETSSGHLLSATLYIPENATKSNPAPAIVTSHGWYNSKEMQDLNNIEYSRRGYVVVSIDMFGHGNSDAVTPEEWPLNGTGMYDAVKLVSELPYVDTENIAVTGHSNGARAANWSIETDNQTAEPLISSVLLVANDGLYKKGETEEFTNNYGNRDVGIIAAKYDEFFFRSTLADGTISSPRDYIYSDNAQSFLHFGEFLPGTESKLKSYETYTKIIDGKEAIRVIYNPAQIHPWNHFSKNVVASSLEFFDKSIGEPKGIASNNQIWQFKVLFNFIGLIGFTLSIVGFTKLFLQSKFFNVLKSNDSVKPNRITTKRDLVVFLVTTISIAFVSGYSYLRLFLPLVMNKPNFFPQFPTFYIGVWSALIGIISLLMIVISYKFYLKKRGLNLRETGLFISKEVAVKTIILALLVFISCFSLVFISDYFFKTDFRIWIISVKAFTPDKIAIFFKYVIFFLLFYVVNSININIFGDLNISKKQWVNTLIVSVLNALGPIVIVTLQYVSFFSTGEVFFKNVSAIVGIWIMPIIVFLIVSALLSRKIYSMTKNPYLPGMINAFMITMISVSTTLTQL